MAKRRSKVAGERAKKKAAKESGMKNPGGKSHYIAKQGSHRDIEVRPLDDRQRGARAATCERCRKPGTIVDTSGGQTTVYRGGEVVVNGRIPSKDRPILSVGPTARLVCDECERENIRRRAGVE